MISSVYTYYLNQYAAKPATRHNSHKKSELRDVYNKMISINKKSPLYKINLSDDMQKLAIDIKESAIELKEISTELKEVEDGEIEKRYKAQVTDEDVADIKLYDSSKGSTEEFTLEIEQLASNQTNVGHYLQPRAKQLTEGVYSFDVETDGVTYELQFSVNKQENNRDIQDKICNIINKSSIGISAVVLEDQLGNTAIKLESENTGVQNMKPCIFVISDEQAGEKSGAVDYLGLDRIAQYPSNAIYTVNGESKISTKNAIDIDNIHLDLKKITEEPISIKVDEDTEMVADDIIKFMESYNRIVDFARNSSDKFMGGNKLWGEFERLTKVYNEVLTDNGFEVLDNGSISINSVDKSRFVDKEEVSNVLSGLEEFRNSVVRKAEAMISNPMEYLDKKIVAYKNPSRSFASPYSSSTYAGIMFDGYY